MRSTPLYSTLLMLALSTSACDQDPAITAADPSLDLATTSGSIVYDDVRLTEIGDPTNVVGYSILQRAPDGVGVRVGANYLQPGTAVTLWTVVFNDPGQCQGPCDSGDVFGNPAAKADMMYTTGQIVGASGSVTLRGGQPLGEIHNSILSAFGLPSYGVLDPQNAELHFVVRTHGPVIPGLENEMIGTFNGGCTGQSPDLGTPGPNTCANLYAALH